MDLKSAFRELNCCVIIPTYNNEKTLQKVIQDTLNVINGHTTLIVVNDGSTDSTYSTLSDFGKQIELVSYDVNQGKGFALRTGFNHAINLGFDRAVTLDSDGQHYPSDIVKILKHSLDNPEAVIMGARNMEQEGVPAKSSFGNKFSNFWFWAFTFIKLDDTQTGYRLYPLKPISKMRFFTKKFEFEIELIVRLAWRDIPFIQSPVNVLYDPDERVSHFRPFKDFTRISILNTFLFLICIVYYYPKRLFSVKTLYAIKNEAIKAEESNLKKSLSIAFGFFMGIVPIWGFQLIVGIPLAILFRLNKVLFISAAHISIPPFIPIIIYSSILIGTTILGGEFTLPDILDTSKESINHNFKAYILGSMVLASAVAVVGFTVSMGLLRRLRIQSPKTK